MGSFLRYPVTLPLAVVVGVVLVPLLVVVALLLGVLAFRPSADTSADPNASRSEAPAAVSALEGAQDTPPGGVRLGSPEMTIESLKRRLDAADAQKAALEERLAAAEAILREHGLEPRAAKPAAGRRHVPPTLSKAFEGVDWSSAGETMHEMTPLLAELVQALRSGGGLSSDLQVRIFKQNRKLQDLAFLLSERGVPGTGINGAFTHPFVYVNLIPAALEAAKAPLTDEQWDSLVAAGDRYLQDEERQRSAAAQQIALERLVAESDLKRAFFEEVDAFLSEAQRNVLHPAPVAGRVGLDLYSEGLLWQMSLLPLAGVTRESIQLTAASYLERRLDLGAEATELLKTTIAHWLGSFSDEALSGPPDAMEALGMIDLRRLRAAQAPMVGLYRDLLRVLPPDSAAAKAIRESTYVLLPRLGTS